MDSEYRQRRNKIAASFVLCLAGTSVMLLDGTANPDERIARTWFFAPVGVVFFAFLGWLNHGQYAARGTDRPTQHRPAHDRRSVSVAPAVLTALVVSTVGSCFVKDAGLDVALLLAGGAAGAAVHAAMLRR